MTEILSILQYFSKSTWTIDISGINVKQQIYSKWDKSKTRNNSRTQAAAYFALSGLRREVNTDIKL